MKIIDAKFNIWLATKSHDMCNCNFKGFVTGPIRIIAAIAQIALNGIASIFLALPSLCIKGNSPYHVKHFARDFCVGLLHFFRGVLEMIPGHSFCTDMWADGRLLILVSDHPFRSRIEDDF